MKKEIQIGLLFIVLICSFVILHEVTHYFIFDMYRCNNIDIKFGTILSYTTADCNGLQQSTLDSMYLAQSINEIIGYNIMPFILLYFMTKL